jgi:hypothetical protein
MRGVFFVRVRLRDVVLRERLRELPLRLREPLLDRLRELLLRPRELPLERLRVRKAPLERLRDPLLELRVDRRLVIGRTPASPSAL